MSTDHIEPTHHQLPPVQLSLPDRRVAIVEGLTSSTTLAEVACAVGLVPSRMLDRRIIIDGRVVAATQTLHRSGARRGSRIAVAEVEVGGDGADGCIVTSVWVSGVDAGGQKRLGAGTHYIGRSRSASVRCDDPALELHHAILQVEGDGSMAVHQLAGLQPVSVGGRIVTESTVVEIGDRIELGASVLVLRDSNVHSAEAVAARATARSAADLRCAAGPAQPGNPWLVPWVRSPRVVRRFEPVPLDAPRVTHVQRGGHGGLVPALMGLVGAAALAMVFDQIMFLLFGALGAVVALGTWLAQRLGLVKSRRSVATRNRVGITEFAAALMLQRDEQQNALVANAITVERAVEMITQRSIDLWGVRPTDADAFRVSLGEGEGWWRPLVRGVSDIDAGPSSDARRDVWSAIDNATRLGTVPVQTSLGGGAIVALVGDTDALAVARAVIVQLAASSGPADWVLAIISDNADAWRGADWLPHAADSGECGRIAPFSAASELVNGIDTADSRHLLLVVDRADLLTARTGPVRRLLAGPRSVACLVVCATEAEVPAVSTSALMIGRNGGGRWISDTRAGSLAEVIHVAGISAARMADACAALGGLLDPEHADHAASLPRTVRSATLLVDDIGRQPTNFVNRIVAGWSGRGADPAPSTPIGVAVDGMIEIDLARDGPHALLAGTTGSGKSELLRTLVLGLAVRNSPDHITFVLIDYKGGSTFDACAGLPHTVGVVTDLDERLAARALRSLEAELRRREQLLRDVGATDLGEYRAACLHGAPPAVLPRLVVVIDEFAGLAVQQPTFIGALLGIAQRGRSLGVHLLLATQRPNGVINDDIRANTNLRIALRVQDSADSTDVIGVAGAARLPRSIPGRAVMRLGADELVEFQTASCTLPFLDGAGCDALSSRTMDAPSSAFAECSTSAANPSAVGRTELVVLVEAVRRAARSVGIVAPHRPWLDPLAVEMSLDSLPAGERDGNSDRDRAGNVIIGITDDPDRQARRALTWPAGSGHLLLVGSTGTGITTTLVRLVSVIAGEHAATSPPSLFIIDALGDRRLDTVGDLACCAALVRLHEGERLMRVLDHLCAQIDARRSMCAAPGSGGDVVVMIDGLGALRSELDTADQWHQMEQLDRIVAEGCGAGIRVAATATRPGSVPSAMLSQIARRWIFHLFDPLDVGVLGLSSAVVPAAVPGRIFDTASGCEAQIVAIGEPACDETSSGSGAPRHRPVRHLAELPADIDLGELPDAVAEGGDVLAPIGLAFDSLGPAVLPIASGEHVLVIGPARSGRTTVLETIAARWSAAHIDGWVGGIARRRSSARPGVTCVDVAALLAAMPPDRPVMIVIDDAELVDDPSGELASRVSARRDDFTVVAAGRGDSLRAGYGHWSAAVRRSRLGLVLAAANELDGDLLGVTLPRRLPIAPRPGLAWLVADGDRRLIQIARARNRVDCDAFDRDVVDAARGARHAWGE